MFDHSNSISKLVSDLSQKKEISEIMINSHDKVFIEMKGNLSQLNISLNPKDYKTFCDDVVKFNNANWDFKLSR